MTPLDDDLLELSMQHAASTPVDTTSLRDALWQRLHETGWTWAPHRERAYGSRIITSDRELLRACIQRDPDAFEELVKRHGGALLAYARKKGDPSEAEGCTQEAFLVLFRKAEKLLENPQFEPRPFLFGTTRIAICDRQRKRMREDKGIDAFSQQLPPEEPDALDQILAQERMQLVERLSTRCRPLEQDVILLALRGHTNEEIARQLDLKPVHVRVLKHRAVNKLKAAIAPGANDDRS